MLESSGDLGLSLVVQACCFGKFWRCFSIAGHVSLAFIIVSSPDLAELPGFAVRLESVYVQEFVSERPVERLDMYIIGPCPWPGDVHFDLVSASPEINDLTREFGVIVAEYGVWFAAQINQPIENRSGFVFTAKPDPNFNGQVFAGEHVDGSRRADLRTVRQTVVNKFMLHTSFGLVAGNGLFCAPPSNGLAVCSINTGLPCDKQHSYRPASLYVENRSAISSPLYSTDSRFVPLNISCVS